jgi:hypothetical protein
MELIKKYYKQVIAVVLGVAILYLVVYLATPKPQMSELDKYKLEQLNKDISKILENQKNLDIKIDSYKKELIKIDSTISKVKNQKTIIKEYYKDKGEKIDKMNKTQLDSLFRKRYNY